MNQKTQLKKNQKIKQKGEKKKFFYHSFIIKRNSAFSTWQARLTLAF
jgi:hypothetical protein